jgi:putative oxidoreductase
LYISKQYSIKRQPIRRKEGAMKRFMYNGGIAPLTSVGLLALRVVMGAAFLFHGWPKIQSPFGWMGPEPPFPGPLVAAAAVAEFGGGIALILGALTRPAALLLAATMAVAAMFHIRKGDPFVASKPGEPFWELAAVYLACSVLFLLAGPGRLSLDALLFGDTAAPARPGP